MTLKAKLLLAQAPLVVALVGVGVSSRAVTRRQGQQTRQLLVDNARSVRAAERMKDALAELHHAAFASSDVEAPAVPSPLVVHRDQFEAELRAQEGNLTEAGEGAVTAALREAWQAYLAAVGDFRRAGRTSPEPLYAAFERVNQGADQILKINHAAMGRKVEDAQRAAERFERRLLAVVLAALLLALALSIWLTGRALRPLGIVSRAVRRFGENDLDARARVSGTDEIAAVAAELNRMAESLARYRASSLGELLRAQQAAQGAIDGLPDPVLLLDETGRATGANDAALRRLGVELEAPGPLARVEPAVRAAIERVSAHVLAGKGAYVPKGFEEAVRITTEDEGERILVPRATPIHDERGAVAGAALVLQDATRLFRLDALKSDLVATVAHELRTPLTSLRMAMHLLADGVVGPLTAKQAELLSAAREDCERLQLMVGELLDLSRIEAGQIELSGRDAAPDALVAGAVEAGAADAERAHVTLRAASSPRLPPVLADPERLRLVFTNLVGNALRLAPAGSEVVVRAVAGPAHAVRFEVADAGPGIAAEHQAGLFEKFHRVPGSAPGGSGLGLFIARGIVQAHGGAIGVESAPGRGATFWFTVPAAGGQGLEV